jgi:hypothetical protein
MDEEEVNLLSFFIQGLGAHIQAIFFLALTPKGANGKS